MDMGWLMVVGLCAVMLGIIVFISFGPEPKVDEKNESKSEKDPEVTVNDYTAGGTA